MAKKTKTILLLFVLLVFEIYNVSAQKIGWFSIVYGPTIYHANGFGDFNSNTRVGYISGSQFVILDTVKRKGLIMDISGVRNAAYYTNTYGEVFKVKDLYANFSIIYPVYIKIKKKVKQVFGPGIGFSLLSRRKYYAGNNISLGYDFQNYPRLKNSKYYGFIGLLDYQVGFRMSRRLSLQVDSRLFTSSRIKRSGNRYLITEGTGIAVQAGIAYRLGARSNRFKEYDKLLKDDF